MTSEINVGSRIRSGGLSLDNRRGVEVMRFANWSWLTLNVTFGNCLWNSSASAGTVGNPDSNTAFSSTGSVPQVGPAAAALADGAAALGGAALAAALAGVVVAADEGDDTVPGDAHAATMRVSDQLRPRGERPARRRSNLRAIGS